MEDARGLHTTRTPSLFSTRADHQSVSSHSIPTKRQRIAVITGSISYSSRRKESQHVRSYGHWKSTPCHKNAARRTRTRGFIFVDKGKSPSMNWAASSFHGRNVMNIAFIAILHTGSVPFQRGQQMRSVAQIIPPVRPHRVDTLRIDVKRGHTTIPPRIQNIHLDI